MQTLLLNMLRVRIHLKTLILGMAKLEASRARTLDVCATCVVAEAFCLRVRAAFRRRYRVFKHALRKRPPFRDGFRSLNNLGLRAPRSICRLFSRMGKGGSFVRGGPRTTGPRTTGPRTTDDRTTGLMKGHPERARKTNLQFLYVARSPVAPWSRSPVVP